LNKLFQNGRVPAIVFDEVNHCRLLIEQIVSSDPRIQKSKVDAMTIAQELYDSGANSEIVELAERLKDLLLQVLDEEYNELRETLNKHQRGGYHEHEAYATGDRVEVIVKALRKGWYRLQ
jgi:hypothetical protein